MIFHLWNSIDKVSARARYDRPKAFRLPVVANMDESDTVTYQPSNYPGVYHGLSVSSIKQARRKSFKPAGGGEDSREDSIESLVASQKSQRIPPVIIDKSVASIETTPGISYKLFLPNTSSVTVSPGLKGQFFHNYF